MLSRIVTNSVAVTGNTDQEGFMTKTMKRALTAFLAIVMVFSYWSVAWADTGDTSNYEIEVVDELEFDGRTYTNLGAHGKYDDPGDGSGTIYMDQCDWDINNVRDMLRGLAEEEEGVSSIFNDTGSTPTLFAGTKTVLDAMSAAKDELYVKYCFNYLSILHVKAKNPSYGELNVMTSDPQVLNKRHVCMWEMTELSTSTDKYMLMYICPEADETSQIQVTQGSDSGEADINFVKGRKLTGFYISETSLYEQQGGSFVGYGKIGSNMGGDVYYMDDNKAKLNYIPGEELHFVFTEMTTAAGLTGDSVEYRLFRGNTEIPKGSGFTVAKDDTGSNLNAIVTISDSIAHQGDNFTLKVCEKAPGGPDTKTGRDLSRPVANISIICLASNPITNISFKKSQYELTTVKNKTMLMTEELLITPSSDYTDKVLFKSSNTAVAAIDQLTGEVTAKKVGTATITAYSKKNPNIKGTCKIVVSNELEQIHISSPDQIVQGHTETVFYTTVPSQDEGCNLQDITWTSSNPSVLKVTGPDATGKVTITAPSNVSLGTDKVETVILTATGKNGVTTDKTITVYENNPSTGIDFTVVNNGDGPECLLKSPVETGANTYSIYGGQTAKINATLKGAEGSTGSTDKIEWFVTVLGTDVTDEPLYPDGPTDQSECISYLTYQFTQGKDNKELIVNFVEGKNRPVIITGKAIGTEAGDTDVHAVRTILFQVNARTNGVTWSVVSGPNIDNVADGDELTIRYTLQPNSAKNLDKVYVVSSDKAVLEILSHSNSGRTGLIKIKAKDTGENAKIKIYATYDTGVTTGLSPKYYDYCQEIGIPVKTNMSHVEITHGYADKIFKNANFEVFDIMQELVVSYGGSVLNQGEDYYLEIKNNHDIGTCNIKIIGKGSSYAGSKEISFKILPYDFTIGSDLVVKETPTYDGLEKKPWVSFYVRKFDAYLTEGKDFVLVYENNVNAGEEASVTAFGINNYAGSVVKTFTIKQLDVAYMDIKEIPQQFYDGTEKKPDIPAKNNKTGANLKIGIDYYLEYVNNVEVGDATIKVTGRGNYTGNRDVGFHIFARNMADTTISNIPDQVFSFGEGIRPSATVKFGDRTLVEGTDYRIDYWDNYNVGTASMKFIGMGDFGGEVIRTFKIKPFTLTASNTTVTVEELEYDGNAKKPFVKVVIKSNNREIGRNDEGNGDYKVTYSNNINSGSNAKVTITGTRNFTGSFSKNFTIKGFNIDRAGVEGIPEQDYTGKAVKPKVKLTFWDKTLKEGTDYKLAYSDNIKPGEATITVTGLGNFYGTKIVKFRIKDAAVYFTSESVNVIAGEQMRLPYNASESVKFKTSDNSICTVNSEGVVFAKMAGKATVTATSASGIKAKITVQVLYKDVTSDADFWYEPTYYLTEKGVAKGYDNQTLFKPSNECSRAQMVTFLWRLAGSPNPTAKTTSFKDVKSSDYYFKAVIWAVEKGITTGVSKTKFDPKGICTRAQTVTFLWRMAGKPAPKAKTSKFKDVKSSDYFFKATIWASEMKIVAGYSDGTFKPQGKCLRRQMVTFLYKYDKFVNGKG